MSKLFQYRADIDGLRAIAVLLVVFFHAKFSAISGGFIGVDVFFVISGFLISIIISKEVSENRFSFKSFYLRRIKRLAPALIALLVLTTIPAYLFLFSDDFEIFGRNLIHAYLSTSNFFLWTNTGGYFSPNTDLFPLLHTWSLAVEEQFYFIWPVLFILINKLTKGKYLTRLMFVFSLSLLALSVYLANNSPHSAYFLLPARAFELMMGAMLAVSYAKVPNFSRNSNHVLSVVGLALIVIPAFIIDKQSVFPGFNAFWPCLGAVLLIMTGKNQDRKGIVNSIISYKAFVGIGLISYSLYLWHWPIFSFIQYLGLELSGLLRVAAVVLSFVLAYVSWRYIEQSVHKLSLPTLGSAMKKIMLPSFLLLTVMYGVIDGLNGFPERFDKLEEFDKKKNFPSTVRKKCHDADILGNIDQCWLGVQKEKIDGMLIGDSFANHSAAFIDVFAKDAGLLIHDSSSGGHPILTRMKSPGVYDYPPEYAEARLKLALQYEHVIIGANWSQYSEAGSINYNNLLDTISKIVEKGKKVTIIFALPPTTAENLHKLKLIKGNRFVFFENDTSSIELPKYWESGMAIEIKKRFPQINFIDMKDVMCHNKECQLTINGVVVYRSNDHFNTIGGRLMAEKYLTEIGNPLKDVAVSK
jgi:peptidoglycan/LPS O-acetylase OafA/YrhL